MTPKRLNIGCGYLQRDGWINLDLVPLAGVDVVWDLANTPWPFDDESVQEIYAKDVIEHLPSLTRVMTEIHRVLAPGGSVEIRVPHFTSKDAFGDPTHMQIFTTQTFEYYCVGHLRSYYANVEFAEVSQVRLDFDCRPGYPWNYVLKNMVNRSRQALNFYEGSPLRIFPATNLSVTLRKGSRGSQTPPCLRQPDSTGPIVETPGSPCPQVNSRRKS